MISGACPVSVKMEQIGNRAVDGDEALTLTCRLKPDHAALSSSRSQMRILCPVVQAFVRTMLDTGHDLPSGCIVGSELVCDHDTRRDALALQQFSHQPKGRFPVPAALDQSIENVAIGIDGTPEPVFPALDGDDHFVQVRLVGKAALGALSNGTGIVTSELGCPFRHGLKRDFNAALGQQILDVAQAQRKSIVQPHSMGDDLGRKAMPFITMRCQIGQQELAHAGGYHPKC